MEVSMDLSEGNAAVVTGGAHGIGLALAREACERGMRVALADVDAAGLALAAQKLMRNRRMDHGGCRATTPSY
jgi:NAD(P)-dependent dehydrogenase (short-subunit alcohol dehydrogenase family)